MCLHLIQSENHKKLYIIIDHFIMGTAHGIPTMGPKGSAVRPSHIYLSIIKKEKKLKKNFLTKYPQKIFF